MKTLKAAIWTSAALVGLAFVVTAPASADFVIIDDLIVDGSACIGFDCVNGESFGFDTIRLKENNLRIKFDDTSTASSYPRNDWQITANDSANGGADKFSIDDITGNRTPFTIEAGARSHSLYVDDGGRIGIRTSTPSTEIHVIDGDTPTLRLQQDGSSGFAPQTWDVAGNETNFFIRDVTNGSQLPFRIRPDAPTNSIFVDVTGDVGMGTSSPSDALHVRRTDGTANLVVEEATGTAAARTLLTLKNTAAGAASQSIMRFERDNGTDVWNFKISSGGFIVDDPAQAGNELQVSPTGNLTVSGNLTATTTGSSIPDYVFEPEYELMPLSELKSFVISRKHLPKVPSRDEVAAGKGQINMTQMQLRLLEKVEELTLYTIAQQEELAELRQEKAALAARLDALEGPR